MGVKDFQTHYRSTGHLTTIWIHSIGRRVKRTLRWDVPFPHLKKEQVLKSPGRVATTNPTDDHSPSSITNRTPSGRLWDRVLFGSVLLFTFLSMCFPLLDTDFWWHLKTGEWILSHGTVPYVDLYTYADADKPWIDLHWGFQIFITLVYRLGGIPLVTLVKSAIFTASVAIAWNAGGPNLASWKKTAIWILPIICIAGRGNERPEMLSQLFLALWLWFARRTDDKPKWIWWLPLVQLIWVNCHALFILGLVVGFCYAADMAIRLLLAGRFGILPRQVGPEARTVAIVGGLAAAACFVNPYFEEGALFPLTLYRKFSVEKDFYSKNIGEFRPPIDYVRERGFNNIYVIAELGTWIIAAASFIRLLLVRRTWSPFRLLLFAGFSHLAWQASRNTNIFSLVAGFVACENFADVVFLSKKGQANRTPPPSHDLLFTKLMTVVATALSLLVVTGIWNEKIGESNKPFGFGEAPNWFIHDAARFAGQDGFPHRAFIANIGQAEVYVYHNGPDRKVFMDARLEVCSQQTFMELNDGLLAMQTGSSRWLNAYGKDEIPVVILDSRTVRPSINGMLMTPFWRLVFADRSAAVFLQAELADKLNLPPVDPSPLMYPDGPPKK